jgi:hypothetical protein
MHPDRVASELSAKHLMQVVRSVQERHSGEQGMQESRDIKEVDE